MAIYVVPAFAGGIQIKRRLQSMGLSMLESVCIFQIKEAADSTKGQSFTCSALLCSALLCSALLCSAVSIWRLFHPCQPLFTSFFKILGKAKPQLYRRKAAIPTREISRRFPADRLQLADPVGPFSFAPPACTGFADNTFGYVQYTTLP